MFTKRKFGQNIEIKVKEFLNNFMILEKSAKIHSRKCKRNNKKSIIIIFQNVYIKEKDIRNILTVLYNT